MRASHNNNDIAYHLRDIAVIQLNNVGGTEYRMALDLLLILPYVHTFVF